MYVPFATPLGQRLHPRKGGGGKGSSGKGSTSKSGTSSTKGSTKGSTSKPSSSKKSPLSITGSTGGGKAKKASPFGRGGGKVTTIPSGQPFAGRTQGGGTRDQVFGSRIYGSGYPGLYGRRGVGGLGFPFIFWPVVWGPGFGYGPHYIHDTEYGRPDNSSRPGGPMTEATFVSATMNSTFHILSDNTTVASLIASVSANCSSLINNSSSSSLNSSPWPFNSSDPWSPRPEQAVQYYRASSVVLTLEGYNNSATLSDNTNQSDDAIPTWTDTNLLYCLNETIGVSVPLIDGASAWTSPSMSSLVFIWLVLCSLLAL